MDYEKLDQEIADLRKIMIDTAAKYNNYSHKEVVERSQELDDLILIREMQLCKPKYKIT